MFQVQTREGNPVSPLFSCYDLARKASWEIPGYRPEDLFVTPIDNRGVWKWDQYWGSWTASVPEGSREFFSGNSPHQGEGLVWDDWLEEQGLEEIAVAVRLWILECSIGEVCGLLARVFWPEVGLTILGPDIDMSKAPEDLYRWRQAAPSIMMENLSKAYA